VILNFLSKNADINDPRLKTLGFSMRTLFEENTKRAQVGKK